jgi:hypothetical protein
LESKSVDQSNEPPYLYQAAVVFGRFLYSKSRIKASHALALVNAPPAKFTDPPCHQSPPASPRMTDVVVVDKSARRYGFA